MISFLLFHIDFEGKCGWIIGGGGGGGEGNVCGLLGGGGRVCCPPPPKLLGTVGVRNWLAMQISSLTPSKN